jgi:hypothetical protein
MTDPALVSQMMDKHPNLYADLSAVSPYMGRSSLLDLEGNLDEHWMELLERHSDRFFFGIDVFLEEHLVSVTSETSYWRKVLGKLRPETAIKIGCSNIENITSRPTPTPTPAATPTATATQVSPKPTEVALPLTPKATATPATLNYHTLLHVGRTEMEGVVIQEATVPFIRLEDGVFYLYMCWGREGHAVATSTDGLEFTEPRRTNLGGCSVNFVSTEGGYRLYRGSHTPGPGEQADMYISSSLVNNLLDFDPRIRTDEGERFRNPGEPCNGWLGTVNAVALPDEGVRVYVSCREHIASFTSPDGLTFGAADETMVEGGIDPEVHILEDGTFRLFHTVRDPENHPTIKPFNPQELVTAVSEDGIHWKTEGIILMADQTPYSIIADPSAMQLEDGSWRIYYGSKNEQDQVEQIVSVRWWPDQP